MRLACELYVRRMRDYDFSTTLIWRLAAEEMEFLLRAQRSALALFWQTGHDNTFSRGFILLLPMSPR